MKMKLMIFLVVLGSSLMSGCTGIRGNGAYEIHDDLSSSVSIVPSEREFSILSIDNDSFWFGNGAKTTSPGMHNVSITCGNQSCVHSMQCNTVAGHIYTVSSSGCVDAGVQTAYNENEVVKNKDVYVAKKRFRGSSLERERNPLKQCYAGTVSSTSDMANPNYGKTKWDTTEPLATELPLHKSNYTNEQRLKAAQWTVNKQCSTSTDIMGVGGHGEGEIIGNTAFLYCATRIMGVARAPAPHMVFRLEILPNGVMVRRKDTCVVVMEDESITAQYVAATAPNKQD